jgi:preprotein translocase subunit YajC
VQLQNLLLPLLLVLALFWILSRSRRQQREAQNLQSRVSPGARIMTTAGLFATVVETGDGYVVLETAPGQRSRWDRRAVSRILTAQEVASVDGTAEPSLVDEDETGVNDTDVEGDHGVEDAGMRLGRETGQGGDAAGTAHPSQDTTPPDRA